MPRGRKPAVCFFASKRGFFATVNGERVRLASCDADDSPTGENYLAALGKWQSLLSLSAGVGTAAYTLRGLANSYRLHLRENGKASALRIFESAKDFFVRYGELEVCQLKAFHYADWMKARRKEKGYADNTVRSINDQVQRALNWAATMDLIPGNPLARKIQSPAPQGRGREAILPDALVDLLVGAAKGQWAAVLRIMWATGCRPEEIEQAEVSHYQAAEGRGGRITFYWNASEGYKHKQARRGTQRDRTIFLSPELAALVEAAIGTRTAGRIFRTTRGRDCTAANRSHHWRMMLGTEAVQKWLRENNYKGKPLPYHVRHTYISKRLDAGMPIKLLADMVGTSVAMIEQTYSHTNLDSLHDTFLKYQ